MDTTAESRSARRTSHSRRRRASCQCPVGDGPPLKVGSRLRRTGGEAADRAVPAVGHDGRRLHPLCDEPASEVARFLEADICRSRHDNEGALRRSHQLQDSLGSVLESCIQALEGC